MSRSSAFLTILFLLTAFSSEAQSLQLAWRYPTGGRIRSQPAAGGEGTIYALSDDGFLYAFSPAGHVRWASNLGGLVTDSLTVGKDGTVYAGLLSDDVVAVNRRGHVIWRFDAGAPLLGNPAAANDGTLFVGTTAGTLYSVSIAGAVEWEITLPARMTEPTVLDAQGTLYLGAADRRLYALTRWGKFKWSLPLPGVPRHAAIGSGGAVYLVVSDDLLLKVSPAGGILWTFRVGPDGYGPLVGERRVFVGNSTGEITAVSDAGKLLWRRRVGKAIPDWVLAQGTLSVMNADGVVSNLNRDNGVTVSKTKVGTRGSLALSRDGELLIGGRDWLVYAYRGLHPDTGAPWSQGSADERHSGQGRGRFDAAAAAAALARIPDYLALTAQFDPTSRDALVALESEIRARIDSGRVGKSTWYVRRFLDRIVGVGILNPVIEGNSLVNDFPSVRASAARLLGDLGSLDSRAALIRVLRQETDPVAAAFEILALGKIGSDGDGETTRTIADAVTRFSASAGNGGVRVARAAIDAITSIAHYEGEIPDAAGGIMLLSIYRSSYPASIRNAAVHVLKTSRP
jgi:outer membrane protein assembly factor BamB